jgi:hypothetical protein
MLSIQQLVIEENRLQKTRAQLMTLLNWVTDRQHEITKVIAQRLADAEKERERSERASKVHNTKYTYKRVFYVCLGFGE